MIRPITKGFTLIELMIVVSIIGILSWFSVPKYQNYILKSTVSSQMLSAVRGLQMAIIEYSTIHGALPSSFSDLAGIGFVDQAGSEFDSASDFSIGTVSGIHVTFPSADDSSMVLGIQFGCKSLSVASCTKVAPKTLQPLTLEITARHLSNNGALLFEIDETRTANKAFKGFLPRI